MSEALPSPANLAAPAPVIPVSLLNRMARERLESTFPLCWVAGEISNLTYAASGHVYFTLKDAQAQVRCVMYRNRAQLLGWRLANEQRIEARVLVTLYEARGDFQLNVENARQAGTGNLYEEFLRRKARLEAEGLFSPENKRALPAFPRRIGVLTSPTGAAVRDVISVMSRRFPLLDVDVLPVPVQGATAAAQIRGMLSRAIASGRYDVLLLARGGGSLEDLWAFNDEALVRAIAASPVPVVSAIGHETDFTIADFAADLRAPTPSAAAELLVPDRANLLARLHGLHRQLQSQQGNALRQRAQRIDRAFLRLHALRPQARLDALARRGEQAQLRLANALQRRLEQERARLRHADAVLRAAHPRRRIDRLRERLQALRGRPQSLLARHLQHEALRLRGLARSLHAISPLATVARGYSILQREDGRVVRGIGDTHPGEALQARLHDGRLRLRVEGTESGS